MSDLALHVPEELVGAVAQRAAEIVLEQLAAPADRSSPWLTVPEAADYLRASRQRIYDVLSSRRLTRHRDGSRVLIRRDELAQDSHQSDARVTLDRGAGWGFAWPKRSRTTRPSA